MATKRAKVKVKPVRAWTAVVAGRCGYFTARRKCDARAFAGNPYADVVRVEIRPVPKRKGKKR